MFALEYTLDIPVFETIEDIANDAQQYIGNLGSESTGSTSLENVK
jgi:hypothetical protein